LEYILHNIHFLETIYIDSILKYHTELSNDVIILHLNEMELNIRITAYMHTYDALATSEAYWYSSSIIDYIRRMCDNTRPTNND